jgi:hypothetical protein
MWLDNGCSFINTSKLTMVSGQSRMSDGAITGFKINNVLTSDFIIHVYNLIGGVDITYAT